MVVPAKRNPIIERALQRGSKSGGTIGDVRGGTGATVSVRRSGGGRGADNPTIRRRLEEMEARKLQAKLIKTPPKNTLREDIQKSLLRKQGFNVRSDKFGNIIAEDKRRRVIIKRSGSREVIATIPKVSTKTRSLIQTVKVSARPTVTKIQQPIKKAIAMSVLKKEIKRAEILKKVQQPFGKATRRQLFIPKKPKEKKKIFEIKKSLVKARDSFEKTIKKRRFESASVSRELSRKKQAGKKLTKNERRAELAAGLQNIGIETLAGLAAIPIAISRPRETGAALIFALNNPGTVVKTIVRDASINPSGFIASMIGVTGFTSSLGKIAKVSIKAAGTTLKYSGKIGSNVVKGGIKVTKTGAKNTYKIVNKAGRKILDKSKTVKFKGKPIVKTIQKSPVEIQKIVNKVNSALKTRLTIEKLIRNTRIQVPKGFKKLLNNLKDKENILRNKLKGQQKATDLAGVAKAAREANALKSLLDKNLKRIKASQKETLKARARGTKASKSSARRERVKQRRTLKKQKGKKGRKEFRKQFTRRSLLTRVKDIKERTKTLKKVQGQLTFKDMNKRIKVDTDIINLKLTALGLEANARKGITNFFKNAEKGIFKVFKDKKGSIQPTLILKKLDNVGKSIGNQGKKIIKKLSTRRARAGVSSSIGGKLRKVNALKKAIIKGSSAAIILGILKKQEVRKVGKIGGVPPPPTKPITKPKTIVKPKEDVVEKSITIPSQTDISKLSPTQLNRLITQIILITAGTAAIIRASGRTMKVPQTRLRGGVANLRKFIRARLRRKKFIFTPDIYSIIFGIRAKPRERIKLLKPGRFFTGTERRKIV